MFFDAWYIFFILIFMVIGFFGMVIQNLSSIFMFVLAAGTILALLIICGRHGGKGILMFFLGFAIIIAGMFCMEYLSGTPSFKSQKAKGEKIYLLKTINEFENNDSYYESGSLIALKNFGKDTTKTDVTITESYGDSLYMERYPPEKTKEYYENDDAVVFVAETNGAVYDALKRKYSDKELVGFNPEQIENRLKEVEKEVSKAEKQSGDDKLEKYKKSIIGKSFVDYNNPTMFSYGDPYPGVEIKIIDENTLEYIEGTYVMEKLENGFERQSIDYTETYNYEIKKNIFGKVYIIIDDGLYKYDLNFDSNYNVTGINVYEH